MKGSTSAESVARPVGVAGGGGGGDYSSPEGPGPTIGCQVNTGDSDALQDGCCPHLRRLHGEQVDRSRWAPAVVAAVVFRSALDALRERSEAVERRSLSPALPSRFKAFSLCAQLNGVPPNLLLPGAPFALAEAQQGLPWLSPCQRKPPLLAAAHCALVALCCPDCQFPDSCKHGTVSRGLNKQGLHACHHQKPSNQSPSPPPCCLSSCAAAACCRAKWCSKLVGCCPKASLDRM